MITVPLARALTQAGFAPLVAANGRESLAIARSPKPDIVVLDVLMPEMGGWVELNTYRVFKAGQGLSYRFMKEGS